MFSFSSISTKQAITKLIIIDMQSYTSGGEGALFVIHQRPQKHNLDKDGRW